jgi:heme exporter protein A
VNDVSVAVSAHPSAEGAAVARAAAAVGGPPAVRCAGLARRFGRRWAFARVDLEVAAGARLLIMGANGSGKTTLLKVISTLIPPSLGALQIFGRDAGDDPAAARSRLHLLSHSAGLYEDLSGADNLAVLGRLLGRPLVDPVDLLARVGLAPRPEPVRTYSAGMRKRLQLAALLLKDPPLTLLDEPFAALDPAGCGAVEALISGLSGTVIVASHQVGRAARLCDQALLMHEGAARWQGPAARAVEAYTALHGLDNADGGG